MRKLLLAIFILWCAPALAQSGWVAGGPDQSIPFNNHNFLGWVNWTNNCVLQYRTGTAIGATNGYPVCLTSLPPGISTNTNTVNLPTDAQCTHSSVSGAVDETATITLAIAQTPPGGTLTVVPTGTVFCTASTVQVPTSINLNLNGSVWRNGAADGTAVAPMIDFQTTSTNSSIFGGTLDARADVGGYLPSTYWGTNAWGDVTIVGEGDYFTAHDLYLQNGFDNCLGTGAIGTGPSGPPLIGIPNNPTNGIAIAGSPNTPIIYNVRTTGCGVGDHVDSTHGGPGKIGFGYDNGSGTNAQISNFSDISSYNCLGNDTGASGNLIANNITCTNTLIDNTNQGSGYSIYNGSGPSSFNNVRITGSPGPYAIWDDYYASFGLRKTQWSNIEVDSSQGRAILMKSPSAWSNVACQLAGLAAQNTYDCIDIDSTAGPLLNLTITGYNVTNPDAKISLFGSGYTGSTGTMTWSGAGCTTNPVLGVSTDGTGKISQFGISVITPGVCTTFPGVFDTTWTAGGGISGGSGAAFKYYPVYHRQAIGFIGTTNAVTGSVYAGPLTGQTSAFPSPATRASNFAGLTVYSASANGGGVNSQSAGFPWDVTGEIRAYVPGNSEGFRVQDSTTGHYVYSKPEIASGVGQLGYWTGAPGVLQLNGTIQLTGVAFASLPTCNSAATGYRTFITDSSSPTYQSVASGGGSTKVLVFCDGVNWRWQ